MISFSLTITFDLFFNHTPTTDIYTLSLHDALPISRSSAAPPPPICSSTCARTRACLRRSRSISRSEEHTSELQSRPHLVCRLLLEKKKTASASTERAHSSTAPAPRPAH